MSRRSVVVVVLALVVVGLGFLVSLVIRGIGQDPFVALFDERCAECHGENLEGTPIGSALVGVELRHGDSVDEIGRTIAEGVPMRGMPGWSGILDEGQIRSLAIFISEQRVDRSFTDFKVKAPLEIPDGTIRSERHAFRIETVATGLDPLPYSIAPLPDGRLLVTEKKRGLRVVSRDGELSELIRGTPQAYGDGFEIGELEYGTGWLMDVALHPGYEENGWIYLHYGDRCEDCGDTFRSAVMPVSMNKLVRGRIRDGAWVDEETIWQADLETYTSTPDMAAGGRIAFDDRGHVFISVGFKGPSNYEGVQDLAMPYGKIHRMNDDGTVPPDNPFRDVPGAQPTAWTYGHRSPQGLEYDARTGQLWSTEMGPRGGDELNLLRPGRNYGWPLTSKGVDYDGTPVEYGKQLGIEFDLEDIEQPVVDLTPSPAVSSFIVYEGDAFPGWRHDAIVGTLKATELYRMELEGDRVVHSETLLEGFARIRDVEAGPDGAIYLLLEHGSGGRIVRLVPE